MRFAAGQVQLHDEETAKTVQKVVAKVASVFTNDSDEET